MKLCGLILGTHIFPRPLHYRTTNVLYSLNISLEAREVSIKNGVLSEDEVDDDRASTFCCHTSKNA
jgi:hypothetical protein